MVLIKIVLISSAIVCLSGIGISGKAVFGLPASVNARLTTTITTVNLIKKKKEISICTTDAIGIKNRKPTICPRKSQRSNLYWSENCLKISNKGLLKFSLEFIWLKKFKVRLVSSIDI